MSGSEVSVSIPLTQRLVEAVLKIQQAASVLRGEGDRDGE